MFELDERFWNKIDKNGDCWTWKAAKSKKGYGRFRIGNKFYSPHRLVLKCFDKKLDVCHKCDNPPCVNPLHLFIGTRRDNMIDASKKGRLKSKFKIYSSEKERRSSQNRRYYLKHNK